MSEQSNEIYELIQSQIKSVIKKLSERQGQDRLAGDISGAMKNMSLLNDQLQTELEKLKENSEWKRFTIAFYGETNAGKSTLIESLRLQLGEKTKQESQQKFKEIQLQFGLSQESFDEVRRVVMDTENAIEAVNQELAGLAKKHTELVIQSELGISQLEDKSRQETTELTLLHAKVIGDLESESSELSTLISIMRAKQNVWKKIIAWYSKTPEQRRLAEIQHQLVKIKKQQLIELQNLDKQQQMRKQQADNEFIGLKNKKKQQENQILIRKQELQNALRKAESEKLRLDEQAKKLAAFADGQIIGDGRSDFTRDNTTFDFDLDGKQFSLIDVPGIEGDETIVSRPIEQAVSKAHAVFYVTRTARPPQTSDGNNGGAKGTLEKIKTHLGAQSEVWSIYNHPANSPRQLTTPLLNEDNRKSLAAMDEKLKAELKEQYCGSFVVSARPAYLALTECIVPGSKEATEQRKFIEKFNNIQTVLSLSGLTEFITSLRTTIIGDYRNKIKRSNLNKAYNALQTSICELGKVKNEFSALEKNVKNEVSNSKSQINVGIEEFSNNLNAAAGKVRRIFRQEIQEQIYADIDDDISNSEFEEKLKILLNKQSGKIQVSLEKSIENEASAFGEKVTSIIKRSNTHLKNIVSQQTNNFNLPKSFNFSINVDSGLNISGLVASGISTAFGIFVLASNPVGWSVAFVGGVLAVVGSIVGLGKSVWGFFDSDYKKSQQRKETDKVLRDADNNIEEKIDEIVRQIKQEISAEMGKIKNQLEEPVKQCVEVNALLVRAIAELTAIARNLKS